jgi:hypothetical protein
MSLRQARRVRPLYVFSLLAALCATQPRAETLTADELRQAGVAALAAGNLDLTAKVARTLTEADPSDALGQ